MHKSSYEKMLWFKSTYLDSDISLDILDIGSLDCSNNNYNYKSIFNEQKWTYDGLDFLDGNNVDILVKDIYNFPEVKDNSYDVVVSGQFFEHLGFFWLTMGEIDRILKPGGFCCIIVPSSGPKHGSKNMDFYRFYEDGMRSLANYVNFDIVHISVDTSDDSKPWCDACLIAKKKTRSDVLFNDLNNKTNLLKTKLDNLIESIR